MTQVSITTVVRDALVKNNVRKFAYAEIASALSVTKLVAKKLCFSFYWFPTEETLKSIIESGLLPNEKKPS